MDRFARRFGRVEPRRQGCAYLVGLLSPLADKNSWTLAKAAGDPSPDGMQRLLNGACRDPDAVRDHLRAWVAEQLGESNGILIVDETGFLKKGTKSAGGVLPGFASIAVHDSWTHTAAMRRRINGATPTTCVNSPESSTSTGPRPGLKT